MGKYAPPMVQEVAPPLIARGGKLRPIAPGPCGDVRVWDDRTLGHDAIWCGQVIVDALLTVDATLEVL